MWFKFQKQIRNEFLAKRSKQPDSDFVKECELPENLAEQGLSIRQTIAKLYQVSPEDVYARDLFLDLRYFEFCGTLDEIELLSEIEETLNIEISGELADRILDRGIGKNVLVYEFVWLVLKSSGLCD